MKSCVPAQKNGDDCQNHPHFSFVKEPYLLFAAFFLSIALVTSYIIGVPMKMEA